MITGSVLMTGGTGTLGQAIAERAALEKWDCTFTIYSRDEIKQQAMRCQYPQFRYVLGDVADYSTLERVIVGHDTVLHLAAFKHIPAGEMNVQVVLETNVIGSRNVAQAALRTGVKTVLGISTDKACQPVNIYGASKMMMERIFQEYDRAELTAFHLCRYGNVLTSMGSVVPVWQKQRDRGMPLTLTDPTMTRFWLTPSQAVDVALLALSEPRGTVTIPRLPGMAMGDFAAAVFPGYPTVTVGTRYGEKQHEDLLAGVEAARVELLTDPLEYYRLHPAWAEYRAVEAYGRYTSEIARQLTHVELLAMLQ